jgi:hypothetical protein
VGKEARIEIDTLKMYIRKERYHWKGKEIGSLMQVAQAMYAHIKWVITLTPFGPL